MPLVAHNDLPTFVKLRESGAEVLSRERAEHQDIRELHIGLLNMMPDAALAATEQQFIRLVGNCNRIAQFYVYPFTLPELRRGANAKAHIDQYYSTFDELAEVGLDALIITGANVITPSLDQEDFWIPLTRVAEWAHNNVASVLCSCLASHALIKQRFGIEREPMPDKQWGVFRHCVIGNEHPLVRDVNTRFDAPHSRFNELTRERLAEVGVSVLAESEEAGVHLAVSPDGIRTVYFQGHPEYDSISLLKEYKREALRYARRETDAPPPFPENYFCSEAQLLASNFIADCRQYDYDANAFSEAELRAHVDNTWGDTAKAIVNNWLGLVYQLTNVDRRRQFMDGIDPDNPLG